MPATMLDAGMQGQARQNKTSFWLSQSSQSCSGYPTARGYKTSVCAVKRVPWCCGCREVTAARGGVVINSKFL